MENKSGLNRRKPRKTLVTQIVEKITDSVISGEYKAGQKLPNEAELSLIYGAGRNSVREAMKILDAMGIVEIRSPEGTFIGTGINDHILNSFIYSLALDKDFETSILGFRRIIEIGMLEEAIAKADENDVSIMEIALNKLLEEIDLKDKNKPDILKILELDIEFHNAIQNAAKNSLLNKINHIIVEITKKSRIKTIESIFKNGDEQEYLIDAHIKFLDIIKSKKFDEVRNAVLKSYDYWKQSI